MDQLPIFECSICCESFDSGARKPKLVPCGHTFCLSCLQQIARDGASAKCPEDRSLINADDPRNLKDNQHIMSWLEELKTRHWTEARLAERRKAKLMQGWRDAIVQEMQRQVSARFESKEQEPEAGNLELDVAKLEKELNLLTSAETVSIASNSWRVESVELQKQPALRIAMLLLLQQGELRELGQEEQQQEDQELPAPLVRLDLKSYVLSGPGDHREEKVALLNKNMSIQALTGVCVDEDPCWMKALLWQHAETLQELDLKCNVRCDSINTIVEMASMPQLRKLALRNFGGCFPVQWRGRLQSLTIVNCDIGLAAAVLRAHRNTLQEVDLWKYDQESLLELQMLPQLRMLELRDFCKNRNDPPTALSKQWLCQLKLLNMGCSMPPQEIWLSLLQAHRSSLQEVYFSRVSREPLLELQRMPALRKLTVVESDKDLHDDPALPAQWRGQLQCLYINESLPQATLLSLLKAHSVSLQELSLRVGLPPETGCEEKWPYTCTDLPALLQQCDLQRLRTLELRRGYHGGHDRHRLACDSQRDAVRAVLHDCNVTCSASYN